MSSLEANADFAYKDVLVYEASNGYDPARNPTSKAQVYVLKDDVTCYKTDMNCRWRYASQEVTSSIGGAVSDCAGIRTHNDHAKGDTVGGANSGMCRMGCRDGF